MFCRGDTDTTTKKIFPIYPTMGKDNFPIHGNEITGKCICESWKYIYPNRKKRERQLQIIWVRPLFGINGTSHNETAFSEWIWDRIHPSSYQSVLKFF